jgi:uncharacterized protein YyaL (SSP411 family)
LIYRFPNKILFTFQSGSPIVYPSFTFIRDENNGGFFLSENEDVLFKQKEIYDGAIPSGNSVALLVLIKLSKNHRAKRSKRTYI